MNASLVQLAVAKFGGLLSFTPRGYIDDTQLLKLAEPIGKSGYGEYSKSLSRGGKRLT